MKTLLLNKFLVLGIFISSLLLVYVYSYLGWESCSVTPSCSADNVYGYYIPLYYSALSFLTFFIFFLFLPFRYFKKWVVWVLPIISLIYYMLVKNNLNPGGGMFEPPIHFLIYGLTIIFWIITILFCVFIWWQGRGKG